MIDETRILLAKSVLPICSWDWQISEPAFYEAIAPSDGCTDGFASRVREFANSIRRFVRHDSATVIATSSARSEADSEQLTEIIAALPLLATEYPVKNPGGGRYH